MMNYSISMKKQKECDDSDEEGNCKKDKLSELPDELIIQILIFLPIRDAVKSVLLRRFGNLWTLIPTLRFDKSNNEIFVFNVLKFHKNPILDKFELFCFGANFCELLNLYKYKLSKQNLINLTKIALKKNPKVVSVKNDDFRTGPYYLPSDAFRNRYIISLYLHNIEIKFPGEVDMSSLRKLELVQVIMYDDTFRVLTSGCPRLQELVIKYSHKLTKLHFTAPNIEKLELYFDHSVTLIEDQSYSLNCPNLKILHVKGICLGCLQVINVSSVQEAKINRCTEWPGCEPCDETNDMAQGEFDNLLNKLQHVEFLELDDGKGAYIVNFCFFILAFIEKRCTLLLFWFIFDYHYYSIQLKPCGEYGNEKLIFRAPEIYLLLKPGIYGSCLVDIIRLLKSSSILMLVTLYADVDLFCDCNMLMHELSSPCVLGNLRSFIIREYKKPCEAFSQLIAFVLKSAVILEEVSIEINGKDELFSAESQEFILQLLSFPRASPKAKVEIQTERRMFHLFPPDELFDAYSLEIPSNNTAIKTMWKFETGFGR